MEANCIGTLWISATGDLGNDISIVDFENQVNESPIGFPIEWDKLISLSTKFEQVMEIVLIGDYNESVLKRFLNDDDMYRCCQYTIELIDSSYWLIHSTNKDVLESISNALPGVEYENE